MSDPLQIKRLLRRPQFLAAAKGASEARGAVVIQRLERGDGSPHIGLGFTATKKIGGAVQRNRAKRRLREAARTMLAQHGVPGSDYVFIARMGTTERAWDRLLDDVKSTLTRLATPKAHKPSHARAPSGQDRQNP
ncbi:ribonuclease P protein component [Brevundimonas diminuta]|uniref:ribonuclease P protein component n=1 Tax=Brevundimonas diminuta TaxID=293 RepID=UPI001F5A4BC3|nr:ribonuclease P protein component [Brevundimonas diminuta]